MFGHQSCSHLMLFTTDDKLYSWNLISFTGMSPVHFYLSLLGMAANGSVGRP